VLGPSSTQADVYEAAVQGLVEDVLDGYNATVMAYGPTGQPYFQSLLRVVPPVQQNGHSCTYAV
jgi:hypothetical protein